MLTPAAQRRYFLTARQAEILGYVCRGWTNRQIAAHLHVELKTVEAHVKRCSVALRVVGARALVAKCYREEMVEWAAHGSLT